MNTPVLCAPARVTLLLRMTVVATVIVMVGWAVGAGAAGAATPVNASSPLGINLTSIDYWTSEQPFIDIMKTAAAWSTHGPDGADTREEAYLDVDADGWPKSLIAHNEPKPQVFTQATVLLLRNLPATPKGTYPGGQYIVRYSGQGTLTYQFDAVKDTSRSTPGRDVLNVKPSDAGIGIAITSTDPNHTGNYIRNIQVMRADLEPALQAGQVFNPAFLDMLRNYRSLRFMDWSKTNGNKLSRWSERSLPSNANWSSARGVPYEVIVRLANAVGADPWVNVPAMADDDFMTRLADLVHANLSAAQHVYVELSNETWNTGGPFTQTAWMTQQGQVTFPGLTGGEANRNFYGMRVAQMCDIWKARWGSDSGRVVCVLGAQAANPSTAVNALECKAWAGAPCWKHGINAVAIAPYFGGTVPLAWTTSPDGGLSALFASLTQQNDPAIPPAGWIGRSIEWVKSYGPVASKYNLQLLAYEGGPGFMTFPLNSELTKLYTAANRDPRMKQAYAVFLQGWRANGGTLYMHFNDTGVYSQWGSWGAIETIGQLGGPLSATPPKWQALQEFIANNPCWWAGCRGSIANLPDAPSNIRIVK